MAAFPDGLDRFVRWFFNSSPTTDLTGTVETARPDPDVAAEGRRSDSGADRAGPEGEVAKPRHAAFARGGAWGGGIAALALFIAFCNVVSDGAERATIRRAESAQSGARIAAEPPAGTARGSTHLAFARQSGPLGRPAD